MMILWIVVPFLVVGLAFFYMGRRFIRPSGLSRKAKRAAWIALVAWGLLLYASLYFSRLSGGGSLDILSWIAYVSLGLLSFVLTFLIIRDLLWGLGRGVAGVRSLITKESEEKRDKEADRSRRTHLLQLTNIGVIGISAAFTGYGIFEARRRPGVVEIDVPIDRVPAAFNGFRIVQISDIHAGLTVDGGWIQTVVDEVKALHPDLIAFTGDIADGSVEQLRQTVAPLASLAAPHGMFFITGNHEYYSGAEEWVEHVRSMGYYVLMNEHRLINRSGASIVLAGVTDVTAEQFLPSHKSDPHAALASAPAELVKIFLAHQPKSLYQTKDLDFDLMLSGHTHGGQFFPWNLLATVDQPFIEGLHRPDGKWVYVNKGTGYWGPPVRVGASSEITVVRLVAGGR